MANGLFNELFQEGYVTIGEDVPEEGYTNWRGGACHYDGYGDSKALLALQAKTNTALVATYHIHPPEWIIPDITYRFFSASDLLMAYNFNIKMYLLTAKCNVRLHTPNRKMIKPNETWLAEYDPSVLGLSALTTKDLIVIPEPICQ